MNTPSHRSKAIKNYVLASVILSILIVLGFTFRSAVMDTVMTVTSIIAKDGTSSETSSKSRARLRVPSSTQHFLDAFPKLLSTLPKSVANLESLVNEVSLKRRSADPHLDKGIRNHWGAALYNPDEKESLFDRQWQNCHASLIENYKKQITRSRIIKTTNRKVSGAFLGIR